MIPTFVLFATLCLTYAQVYVPQLPTLSQLASSMPPKDSLEHKAILFVLQSHPELANYTVLQINKSISRGNQTYADNLRDFLFKLDSPNNSIIALVTMTNSHTQDFITVSPLVTRMPS